MGSEQVKRGTGRQVVYETLRARILLAELPPGAALSENEVATSLGVSRTPVREGLALLEQEGLVKVFPKVGTFVSRVDPAEVAEAQFLRESVELAALRSLSSQPTEAQLQMLKENLAQQRVIARRGENQAFFQLDEDFHRGLMELSGHGASWRTITQAKGHLDRARMVGIRNLPILDHLIDEHETIFNSIQAGDVNEAADHLRAHLRTVFTDLETLRARAPELFQGELDPGATPVRKSVVVWE